MNNIFPTNPSHKDVVEINGSSYEYDVSIRSWVPLVSASVNVSPVTVTSNGLMTSVDYNKLNRLVLSPPISTIKGNNCVAPFMSGNIGLYSGDDFISVSGNADIKNVDSSGDKISKSIPFQIHKSTYAFDFSLNLPELVNELQARGQFNTTGKQGPDGEEGLVGAKGIDHILTGPPGDKGPSGAALPCDLSIESENINSIPVNGLNKVLVDVEAIEDPDDQSKFRLVFNRQAVGPTDFSADRFNISDASSPWVLAITGQEVTTTTTTTVINSTTQCDEQQFNSGKSMPIYYVDVEPIINAIHKRYITQATILRNGYQNIVRYWIQAMSDLFDEQKTALCNALEHCMSIQKNVDARQHMENVAAAAAGSANIMLHNRDSNESATISSTRTLEQIGAGPDICKSGDNFPLYPNVATGGVGGFGTTTQSTTIATQAIAESVQQSQPISQSDQASSTMNIAADNIMVVDSVMNHNMKTSIQLDLDAGSYIAIIRDIDANLDGMFGCYIKIQYNNNGVRKSVKFIDKGSYEDHELARQAYEGLTLAFNHSGGYVSILSQSMTETVSGTTTLIINKNEEIAQKEAQVSQPIIQSSTTNVNSDTCVMTIPHLSWYERGWISGMCCGLVLNVMGQDYIIIKKSIGRDLGCGGGEKDTTECIAKFKDLGHPAFAWPTFNKKSFVDYNDRDSVSFQYVPELNKIISDKIKNGEYENSKGSVASVKYFLEQLSVVLFPVM